MPVCVLILCNELNLYLVGALYEQNIIKMQSKNKKKMVILLCTADRNKAQHFL